VSVSERLAALGIDLPAVAAPAGAYVPAVRVGDLIHTAGQLPFVDAAGFARVAALNAVAAAASVAGGVDALTRIVKVVVFVASDPAFTAQPQVANGASELLGDLFGTPHARSAVGVAVLPLDSPVEIELIAESAAPAN
jgi:enamine deaminase RidA (YjgF/YER057c/UK114 family)